MMEAVRTSETSVDNHFIRQYNPEDNYEQQGSNFSEFETERVAFSSNQALGTIPAFA
jgi:hypothetical protein